MFLGAIHNSRMAEKPIERTTRCSGECRRENERPDHAGCQGDEKKRYPSNKDGFTDVVFENSPPQPGADYGEKVGRNKVENIIGFDKPAADKKYRLENIQGESAGPPWW